MQSNILQKTSLPVALCIKSNTGQLIQVRNHVKMYPWRANRSNRECYLDNSKTPYTDRFNINEFGTKRKQKKEWMKVIPKDKDARFNVYKWNDAYKSDPKEAKETARSKLSRFQDSLKSRGHARETDSYTPPNDVEERILALYRASRLASSLSSSSGEKESISSKPVAERNDTGETLNVNINQIRELKFDLISKCIEEFKHDLPSSYLNDIECLRDLVEYFSAPVRGINPYSAMLRKEDSLPANLSLVAEPIRFDKETDEFFQGHNALPGIISKVHGLRASKKYPILNQDEFQWPDI